jgi:hypothetical protein
MRHVALAAPQPLVLALTLLALSCLHVGADEIVSFDQASAGQPPPGWTATITGEGQPEWRLLTDPTAPSAPHVLRQSGLAPRPSFPLCLHNTARITNGFVEVKFKTVSGTIDQAAGVVWRVQNVTNYYVCRANALENNVVLYKVQHGKRTALDIVGRTGGYGVETPVRPATWQTLRVEFADERFKVFLDGKALFEVIDTTFSGAGGLGLWTKADSVTLFDDYRFGTSPN